MNLNKFQEKLNRYKFVLADKLMRFSLDKKVDNIFLMRVILFFYTLLVYNTYVLEHTPANNHYIPQFLLRKFKVPNTGLIYEYSYFKKPEKVSIEKKAAQAFNLYSTKNKITKTPSDFIEKHIFALTLEKYASRIINEILKEKEDFIFTNLEESILASYVAFQYTRTPRFLFLIKKVLEYLVLEKKIKVEEMVEREFYKKVFFDNYYNIKPQELGSFGVKNKMTMAGAENVILALSLSIGNHISSVIHKMDLRLLVAKDPAYFFLSDSGTDIFNMNLGRSIGPFMWEIDKNSLVYLPLSPNHCLYYVNRESKLQPPIIGRILEYAIPDSIHEFAYSDRYNVDLENKLKTTANNVNATQPV